MGKLRVLLADDHAVVREGLKAFIAAQPDVEVVGEASDGETACRKAADLRPDVVVMDVSMPGLSGVEVTERLKRV
ncbi:response regulator, partial [Singulisphaera rosea]